ncbi:MAG: PRC-barrel domain-containing protein [Rhizobiaceae bacterium]
MNRNTYLALLAAVSIPFAAIAQEKTTQDPAAQEEQLIESGEQAAEETAPADETEQMAEEEMAPADDTEQAAEAEDSMTEDEGAVTALAGEADVEGPFVTVPLTGAWRVTDLEGKDVEDANGDNIGDITDVLVNEKGEVIAVLVGVGGFLGIGQKDVAVSMSALQFGPGKTEGLKTEEQRQQELQAAAEAQSQLPATGTGSTGLGGTATTNTTASIEPPVREDPVVGRDNLPDRIVLNVTREELEAAPAYEDIVAGIDSEMTSEVPATEPVEPKPTE